MIVGRVRTALRFARVMLHYRWAAVSLCLRWLAMLPGFKRSVVRLENRYEVKQHLKKNNQSIGHALGDRTIVCAILGQTIAQLRIPEGVQATADQFFLNRPICDAKNMISLARQHIEIKAGDLVFDPGCGAGRHLFHFVDAYGCEAIGVDVYQSAIDVAETANCGRLVRFYAQSSLQPGFLDAALPSGCDFVFINSWLNHVKDYPGYREFADQIISKCRFLMVINSWKDRLEDLFDTPDILAYEVREGTQYALVRGRLRQTQAT